jgi:tripartite-type tricarboxylate transporter receptor subunit TctC
MTNKILALIMSCMIVSANAESIEFTVMHGPGGVSDITTRHIAKHLDNKYIVINRPGAAGKIAIGQVISEKTMMLATTVQVFVTNPLNFNDLNYDPKTDLEVLATVGVMPSALLCNSKTGIKSFYDLQNYTKPLSFAVGGYGSSEHIATEVLLSKFKVDHTVIPYATGGNKSIVDLLGGHIDCMFGNYPTVKSHIDSPNLKLLLTSHNVGLSIPTWETVYKEGFPFQSYLSIIVPSTMDLTTKKKIRQDLESVFINDDYQNGITKLGLFLKSDTDPTKIKKSLTYNESIRKFILDNNISTSR